jgi:diguanylate cyclase (GGDEF)-like protein
MVAGDQIVGLLALASYEVNAFSESDAALMTNIAGQAALALDNANHHAQVQEQARRDSLTGAYNHGHLLKRLEEEVQRSLETGSSVSLIMLDIDNFKQYNDRFGHAVGDSALLLTVKAIRAHVKHTDVVGRWGGEEFGIVLPGARADDAHRVAQRIRKTLAELVLPDSNGVRIPNPTVSQGLATCPDHTADPAALVDLADQALYRAKSSGRDQVVAQVQAPA